MECIAAKEFDVLLKCISAEFRKSIVLLDAGARIRKLSNHLV